MKKELNTNNSKKLIIGVSIIFCTIILIIGVSFAYFTQSDSKSTGDITTTKQVTLEYDDSDNSYMLGELIPTSEEFAIRGYEREEDNKCKDDNGYNICSVYRFTITNTANISQKLVINMTPTLNTFYNLKFMLYEVEDNIKNKKGNTFNLEFDKKTPILLEDNLTLEPNENKTYELVYYILNLPEIDQTSLDAGKNFGAKISVNSVTTGNYISNQEGASCWDTTPLEDGSNNFKLTKFKGINNDETSEDYGKIVSGCEEYVSIDDNDQFYSITVPSTYGNDTITTLGNALFQSTYISYDEDDNEILDIIDNYTKIKSINISVGITSLEDGSPLENGTFFGTGMYFDFENDPTPVVPEVSITFPSSFRNLGQYNFVLSNIKKIVLPEGMTEISDCAFLYSNVESLSVPSTVVTIGDSVFSDGNEGMNLLKELIFVGADNDTSQLTTIGTWAFGYNKLENIILPNKLKTIGDVAFGGGNLTNLTIPASVETIGLLAFCRNKITSLTFDTSRENKLYSIGWGAFVNNNLTYETSPLIIPANVQIIEESAFFTDDESNPKLLKLEYKGASESILNNTTDWYNPDYTKLNENN